MRGLKCYALYQVHESYEFARSHRGRGTPFLTEYQEENEEFIKEKEPKKSLKTPALPGLGFGVGERDELATADSSGEGGDGDKVQQGVSKHEVAEQDKLESDWRKWKEAKARKHISLSRLAVAKLRAKHRKMK